MIADFSELNPLHTYFNSKICFALWKNYAERTIEKLGKNGNFTENSNEGRKRKDSISDEDDNEVFDSDMNLYNMRSPRQTEILLVETIV